ncbi:hypothetical protein EN833_07790 [Mesorhizobium sp. M4B.F.Ca.ET.190.01.1.1]|nr:hypothetical protein [Mesorhizobium sp. M4B.F.Ca.ET.172.01.1.1]TGR13067.1 hypothetical protein EN843_07785 [Mesorhizobium sp. M4B.F.Ca.ET.200.01.1.1]TGS21278.1 hypothetical protein EN833_07790 [Mesorhizobium sp. M4B.F.Ca.ET.190.01.1.1]
MQFADAETCLAWPTQESLVEMSGLADTRQVRSALASLAGSGAIKKKKVSELSEESQGKLDVKRKSRGAAYKLMLFWAYEILEFSLASVRAEPSRLASSDKTGNRTTTDRNGSRSKRTTTDRQKRTTTDRFIPDYDRPPNTTEETKETEKSAEGKDLGVYTREASAYALASRAG